MNKNMFGISGYTPIQIDIPNMKPVLIFSVLLMSASAFAAEPTTTCVESTPKKVVTLKPAKPAKPAEPLVQEITLHCGSPTSNQSIGERPTPKANQNNDPPAFSWDKTIEAVAKLLESIAWPLAGIYIAYLFRKELTALLSRLKRGKLGSAEFEFENYVREVDAEAEIPRTPEGESISPTTAARVSTDPRGAIVSSWVEVEDALFNLVKRRQLDMQVLPSRQPRSVVSAIRAVQKAEVLDAPYIALFHDLRAMRNEAAHSTDFSAPPEAVIKYVQLAKELTNAMRTAAQIT